MTNDSHKARLSELVKELAVIHEKVTLASGRESDFYVDMRRATLHHEAAPLIGHVMLDLLEEAGFTPGEEYVAVGDLTMGADPVAAAMLHAAASRGLDLDAFVVRKAAKDHGMKRRIEGPDVTGKRVVVLEDTSTTGGSPLEAVAALKEAGAEVVAVAVIVDRATGAKERIEAEGFPYFYALGLDDLDLIRAPSRVPLLASRPFSGTARPKTPAKQAVGAPQPYPQVSSPPSRKRIGAV